MERRPRGVTDWRSILRRDFDTVIRFWRFRSRPSPPCAEPALPGPASSALACDITIASEDAFFGDPS